jgi:hypothetical protein
MHQFQDFLLANGANDFHCVAHIQLTSELTGAGGASLLAELT